MLRWSVIFLLVALVAALVGYGGMTESVAPAAKTVFYVFIGLFVFSLGLYKPAK